MNEQHSDLTVSVAQNQVGNRRPVRITYGYPPIAGRIVEIAAQEGVVAGGC